MFTILQAGGVLMFPLVLCSIIAGAIVIERAYSLRRARVLPPNLRSNVALWLNNTSIDVAKVEQLRSHSPLGSLLGTLLFTRQASSAYLQETLVDTLEEIEHRLERFLNGLGTIATIAPLLGLLGTVFGMIQVFTVMMQQGPGDAQVLSGGIAKALLTTAAGLVIAIPSVIFYRYYERRIEELMMALNKEGQALIHTIGLSRVKQGTPNAN